MSVWTKIQTKVLERNVDMEVFETALEQIGLTMDHSVKEINNAFGFSDVDAGLKYNDRLTSLGIVITKDKGINLVGDTWRSGIVGDKQADVLVNMMSQAYQKVKLERELAMQGWEISTIKQDDKIILECIQL